MSLLTHLECSQCGRREDAAHAAGVCSDCGAALLARYDLALGRHLLARAGAAARERSLWRMRELLPPAAPEERVTLGEGSTPLLRSRRLEEAAGHAPIFVKDESQNPTYSFKARGMAMAVTAAVRLGGRRFAVPSAGNAGGALAAYAARAGAESLVVLPADTPRAFVEIAALYGAQVELVDGHIGDAGKRVAARREEGWIDISTFKEPYRVEGKKTLGFEIVEDLGWRYPDWIVYPTGGGTGLWGCGRLSPSSKRSAGSAGGGRAWRRCRRKAARRSSTRFARARATRSFPRRPRRARSACACRSRSRAGSSSPRFARAMAPPSR
jgi:threonine synthase